MANPTRQNEFNDGTVPNEAKFEGEFDNIYNALNGVSSVDVTIKGALAGNTLALKSSPTLVADVNGNELIKLSPVASAVSEITIANAATGDAPSINPTGENGASMIVNKNTIITNDVQLTGSTADGFANTTKLYIWNLDGTASGTQTDVVGGKQLTVGAGALTAGADVLGVSKYCAFNGSTYLKSADNDAGLCKKTGDFSVGGWVYMANWASMGATVTIFGDMGTDSNNGWVLYGIVGGLSYRSYNGGATVALGCDVSGLSAGWHQLIITRNATENPDVAIIYIDGVAVASNSADMAIGASATHNFTLGDRSAADLKMTGRIDEFVFYNETILTPDQIRNIYAHSAKKFAVKDANANVYALDNNLLKLSSGSYVPVVTSSNGTITAGLCSWIRVGNIVNVGVTFVADVLSGGGTITNMTISLPIACTSTPTLGGCACPKTDTSAQVGTFTGGSATVANLYSAVYETDSITWGGSFQYVVN